MKDESIFIGWINGDWSTPGRMTCAKKDKFKRADRRTCDKLI